MRKVMYAAAAITLLAPLGAAAGDKQKSGEKLETKSEAARMDKDKTAAMDDVVTLEADQLSAKELLGEGVIGSTGERIARIDDLVIDDEGEASSVIFLSGGFFGLGGKKGALDYDRVDLAIEENHDPRVRVSMTEEAIQTVAEFETDSANDYSLASEIIGASARLSDSDEEATISDLILDRDGKVRYVVAHEGVLDILSADRRAFAFSDLTIEEGAGGLILNATADSFKNAARFEYHHTAEVDPRDSYDADIPSDQQ